MAGGIFHQTLDAQASLLKYGKTGIGKNIDLRLGDIMKQAAGIFKGGNQALGTLPEIQNARSNNHNGQGNPPFTAFGPVKEGRHYDQCGHTYQGH